MSTVQDPNRTPEEEISRLAEKYQLSLLRLCFAYLHDRTLAEDAVQETFLKAYRSISSFRNESSEKTWLSHIAIICCRDMNKSAWARFFDRRITPDMLPAPSESPSEKDDNLTVAVMELPPRLRETVLLYYFEDMTTVEIAETLHISQQAVSGRLKRALSKLRAILGDTLEGDEPDDY